MKEKIKGIIIICSILITIVGALISEITPIGAYFAVVGFFTLITTILISRITNEAKIKYKNNAKKTNIKPDDKIEELYTKISEKNMEELEKYRKKLRNITVCAIIMTILFFLTGALFSVKDNGIYMYILFIFLLIFMVKLWNKQTRMKEEYKKKYKKEIVYRIIKSYDSELRYSQAKRNEMKKEYKNSSFDKGVYDIIECDDYIEGNIDKESIIRIIDINTYKKKGNKVQDVFTGIFANINLNNKLEKTIKIVNNSKLKEVKNIELDNFNFERYFDVYCKDKILATRVLTAEVMEKMVSFYKKLEIKFEIILKDSNLYLRFYTGEMFEPNIFKNTIDKKQIYKHYNILKFVLEVSR